jgi:hypothetical protein
MLSNSVCWGLVLIIQPKIFHITKPEKKCNALYLKEHKSLQLWIKRTLIASDCLPSLLDNQEMRAFLYLFSEPFSNPNPGRNWENQFMINIDILYKFIVQGSPNHQWNPWNELLGSSINTRLPINYSIGPAEVQWHIQQVTRTSKPCSRRLDCNALHVFLPRKLYFGHKAHGL